MSSRDEMIAAVKANPQRTVLIIGGGINGIGTFRDLALQDVEVLLVEMNDFCSGASAASSHMVHGGLRYLENGEFRLVREALTERNRLLQNAPHYVKPLPTTIPIFSRFSGILNAPLKFLNLLDRPSSRGALVIKIGLTLYDWFTRNQQTLPKHTFTSKKNSLAKRPRLNPDILWTATYYDAWMPYPERISIEQVLDAETVSEKAHAINYVKAVGAAGNTVTLQDVISGETFDVEPKIVINAAGPWIDFANSALNQKTHFIGGTKGSHLIVDHPELHAATQGNEMFFENADGRITLFFPLNERVLIGTTDIRLDNPDEAVCTDAEIDYMLDMVKIVFPEIKVDRSHIVYHFSGVRPLPSSDAKTAGQISRDHSIQTIEAGNGLSFPILSLVGGKWTTFRAFSEQVTDTILKRLNLPRKISTAVLPFGGGKNYPQTEQWLREQRQKFGISETQANTLFERYGTRMVEVIQFMQAGDDAPLKAKPDYTRREVLFLAQHEKVVHLEDILQRRSLLAMLGFANTELLAEIAEILAEAFGWTEGRISEEINRTVNLLTSRHGVSPQNFAVQHSVS